METYGNVDSKFRFVIVASKRAKLILKGAKVKIKTKTRNPIRIAQLEVRNGLVEFDILKTRTEELLEIEEPVFSAADAVEVHEEAECAVVVDEEETTEEVGVDTEVDTDYDDDFPANESGEDKESE